MKKILVTIVNYGTDQLQYLEQVVKEFGSFDKEKYSVDICVHSNIILPEQFTQYNLKTVIVDNLDDYDKLPFTTRQTIYDNRNDYDLFIYNENDHLITQNNVDSFLKVTEILPKDYIAGNIQYESYPEYFYPGYHAHYGWKKDSVFKIGEYVFAEFTNKHQGSFILTKEQLTQAISKLDFLHDVIRDSGYNMKPRAGTDVYTHAGFKKVICISHFNDFLIWHLPNKYRDHKGDYETQMGRFDNIMQQNIKELLGIIHDPLKKKIQVFVRHCNFSANNIGKTRPSWYSQKKCYENLKKTIDPNIANITFVLDGDINDHFLKNEKDYQVVCMKGGSDAKSFMNLLGYVVQQNFSNDQIIYFLEDDFIHRKNWCKIMCEGFAELSVEYVTLYDHKDKYFLPMYDNLQASIMPTASTHWRTTPSTTNTYAMRFGTLKKHIHIHQSFCDLDRGFTRDHDKFLKLWSEGSCLISPIPGYSTHCETEYLSPCIDWEKEIKTTDDLLIAAYNMGV